MIDNPYTRWVQANKKYFPIYSQNPSIAGSERQKIEANFLPALIFLWHLVEEYTGHAWKCTSYWRNSPSHRHGYALDIAPDIAPRSERYYAFSKMSDPVLYKRTPLMTALQKMAKDPRLSSRHWPFVFSAAVEPDHIHLSLFAPDQRRSLDNVSILKWKVEKPIYPDSKNRMNLPMWTQETAQYYKSK
jgi:hypothetical protein